MRAILAALVVGVGLSGLARAQDVGILDTAAEIADQAVAICAAVVFDGQSFESQLDNHPDWRSVEPNSTGSRLATHAWQSRALNTTYVMRLPNGGCSFGIERGDSAVLRERIMTSLNQRARFEPVLVEPTRGGRAMMHAYCVREDYPRVVSIMAGQPNSHPNVVFNMFRASDRAPDFCATS
ncbi:MAG: hypothetical protein AB7O98_08015 [Hyphomonadaceae bacterium]